MNSCNWRWNSSGEGGPLNGVGFIQDGLAIAPATYRPPAKLQPPPRPPRESSGHGRIPPPLRRADADEPAERARELVLFGVADLRGDGLDAKRRFQQKILGLLHPQIQQHLARRAAERRLEGVAELIVVRQRGLEPLREPAGFRHALVDELPEPQHLGVLRVRQQGRSRASTGLGPALHFNQQQPEPG